MAQALHQQVEVGFQICRRIGLLATEAHRGTPDDEHHKRSVDHVDGGFQINADGEVVMSNGYPLQPGIVVPENALSIAIGKDGTVTAQLPGEAESQQLGQIQLADFVNPAGLQAMGENLFLETGASGAVQTAAPGENGIGTVIQGALETSNVNMAEELVQMIETQRAYEVNSKAVAAADQMLQFVNNNLAR